MKTFHYIVKGRVQGVAFRYYTQYNAHLYNIKGTVKNLFNGDVEVYAQGNTEMIEQFEAFLRRGPSAARVETLLKEEIEMNHIFKSFEVVF